MLTGNDVFLYCGETQLQIEFESGENRKTDSINSIKNNRLTLAKRLKPLPILDRDVRDPGMETGSPFRSIK